ncbi:Ig-like domain-containing protein [Planctomycetota bacterium]
MIGQRKTEISIAVFFLCVVLCVWSSVSAEAADVKCAIIQFSDHHPDEVNQDADRLENYVWQAAANGAKLIVAPENCLYRYSPWDQNGVTALELANSFNTLVTRFKAVALELRVCIVFGLREPSGDGVKPTYQSGVFIDHKGNNLKTYRKRVPSSAEISYTKAGGGWDSFNTPVGKVFMQICKDMDGDGYINSMPTDIDLLIGINKDADRGWVKVDAGCLKASCYGIGVNYAGDSIHVGGNSGFVNQAGTFISEAGSGNYGANEVIIYETLPLPADPDLLNGPVSGQIIRDPDNPQWLKRHNGSHVFICGPGDPEGFLYRGTRNGDGTRSGDQVDLINKLITNGGNSIYMQIVRSHGGDGSSDHNPFVGSNPSNGIDQDILNQWETWFTLMDDNNILIYLFFYDDGARPWNTGDSVGSTEKTFIETIVNTFEHHKNLIWIVGEESEEAYSHTRVRNIAQTIADADDHNHIIGNHHLSGTTFKAWAAGSALTHYSMQYNAASASATHSGSITARNNGENAGAGDGYMVIYSENTSRKGNNETDTRNMIWEISMGGVMPMRLGMDIANTPVNALKQCRYLQEFFESTDFYTMKNYDSLKSGGTTYLLANPGVSYIAYALSLSGGIGIQSMASGEYKLVWLDCVDGEKVTQTNINVPAGTNTFSKPATIGVQCAVWVTKTGGGDPQPGQVQLIASSFSVNEGNGTITITIERTGGSEGPASVDYSTSDGTASAGSDYQSSSGTLNWADGESGNKTFSVTILEDTITESNETFSVTLSNAVGASMGSPASSTVTITDNDIPNQPPVADDKSVATLVDTEVYIQLAYTDPDGPGPYTITIVTQPLHGTLTGSNNDRYYMPDPGYEGTDSFTWKVNDGEDDSNIAAVTITVTAPPPPPPSNLTALPISSSQIDLTWTDNSANEDGFRIERSLGTGGPLTVTLKTYNGSYTTPTVEQEGTANSFKVGALQVNDRTPTFDSVPAELSGKTRLLCARNDKGQSGYNTMYTVTLSGPAVVYAAVSPEYSGSPIPFMDGTWTDTGLKAHTTQYPAGTDFSIWKKDVVAAGDLVLGADDDGSKQGACYVFVGGAAWTEIATVTADTAAYSDTGLTPDTTYTYRVRAFNANGNSDYSNEESATTFADANNPPVAVDDNASANEDTSVIVNVLANDTDGDGDQLTVISNQTPANGTAVVNGDNTITYTPNVNYNGTDSFTYTISDGNGGTDTATVTVTVNPVNDAPVANNDSATTAEDTPVTVNVLLNDTDVDGDSLAVTTVGTPSNGTAAKNGDNTITYIPNAGYNGSDSFSYGITDGKGGSANGNVSITVTEVNIPPVADDQSVITDEDTAVSITLTATDDDGDVLTNTIVSHPGSGILTGTPPNVTYTPFLNYNGNDSFTFKVNDGQADSNTATVSITVNPVNDVPVANNDSSSTQEDTGVTIDVLTNDTDPDSDQLSVISNQSPVNGTAVINGDDTITYTPDTGYTGSDSFTYTISDGNGGTDTATVSVTVNEDSGELEITSISRTGYVTAILGLGDQYYIDRSYTIADLPQELDGLTWIKTANNDKFNTAVDFLTFQVNQEVTVYIGYDHRAFLNTPNLPAWMSDFTDTGLRISVTDGGASPLHVYEKKNTDPVITLGGNVQGGSTGAGSNYVIIIKGEGGSPPPPPPNEMPVAIAEPDVAQGIAPLTVTFTGTNSYDPDGTIVSYAWDLGDTTTGSGDTSVHTYTDPGTYQVTLTVTDNNTATASDTLTIAVQEQSTELQITIQQPTTYAVERFYVGSSQYVDRSYTITSLPIELEGAKGIRTANNDKYKTAADHLVFTVDRDVDVYAVYDNRATILPTWLTLYADTGWTISTTDVPMSVYRMTYQAGTITLGGNHQGGDTGARSNCFVIITEKGAVVQGMPLIGVPNKRTVLESEWSHTNDTDGDGLGDQFELEYNLNPYCVDTYNDGIPDETRTDEDGNSMFDLYNDTKDKKKDKYEDQGGGCMPGTNTDPSALIIFAVLGLAGLMIRKRS